MRPSTYALGSTTFGFYSDSFHSQIRSLALYYELVEFKSFSVEYVPPVAVGAAAQLL